MELIKLARFILFSVLIALGGYVLYATKSHPGFVIGVTAAAAFGLYLRPWPLGAGLTWAGLCGMALLYTGDGGFLELGVFGAPVIAVIGGVVYILTFRKA